MIIPDDILDTMTDDDINYCLDEEVADMWLSTIECQDIDLV